jgi:hypothetical protein
MSDTGKWYKSEKPMRYSFSCEQRVSDDSRLSQRETAALSHGPWPPLDLIVFAVMQAHLVDMVRGHSSIAFTPVIRDYVSEDHSSTVVR